jgi:HlyD family secretion protein
MKRIIIFVAVVVAVIGVFLLYFHIENNGIKDHIFLYGNVDVRQVEIGFRVSGQVDALKYEEGDLVPVGALMATLDKKPYTDQVRQAEATVESIKASLANAELLVKRRSQLVGFGGVSKEDFETATSNRDVLIAQLEEAQAALAIAKTNLEFTEVYGPTEGTILARIREPGTVVLPSEPVYTLSVTSPVWIRAYVTEPQLGLVFPGMKADIFTDTPGGAVYHGQVGFISPVSEFTPKTVETTQLRTDLVYRIRIYADNPDKGLRQGMPVTCKLYLNKEPK